MTQVTFTVRGFENGEFAGTMTVSTSIRVPFKASFPPHDLISFGNGGNTVQFPRSDVYKLLLAAQPGFERDIEQLRQKKVFIVPGMD